MNAHDLERTLRALGLCARARGLIFGTSMICDALQSRIKPRVVLAASDISENTAKRLRDRCSFYETLLISLPCEGERLAQAVGKGSKLAAVAISDENLCRLVLGTMEEESN